ncbi:MAG: hypothetical protein IJY39_07775 [Clostridia bacterium]|nr:hypothetical protein [Clostridia bacterium]
MQFYINGKAYRAYQNNVSKYVIYTAEDESINEADVRIVLDSLGNDCIVRPLSSGIKAKCIKNEIAFKVSVPCKLSVEFSSDDIQPVFLFFYRYEDKQVQDGNLRYYGAGEHTEEEIRLNSGDILYLDEGAILHSYIVAEKAENITICGRGIIDNSCYSSTRRRMMIIRECKNVTVKDITLCGSNFWCCTLVGCENVLVDSVNIISWLMCGDGVDVVGSHDVTVQNCFMRTADDCVAIKATEYIGAAGMQNVYNVKIKSCVMWNANPGNGIEIGFETRCDEIYNIEFSDIDIIHCEHEGWQSGGAITIHNGDRAKIHDVVYRNIRVEDCVDKWFDFKILRSDYSKDEVRGSIENVLVENVALIGGAFPPSILSGFKANDSLVRNIRFVNISAHGEWITGILECRMIAERTKDISFQVT